jgi:hypothetical protein
MAWRGERRSPRNELQHEAREKRAINKPRQQPDQLEQDEAHKHEQPRVT